jgi:hypothetical protein
VANYLAGKDMQEFESYQQYRALAKAIAKGMQAKADIAAFISAEVPDRIGALEVVTEAIVDTLNEKNIL